MQIDAQAGRRAPAGSQAALLADRFDRGRAERGVLRIGLMLIGSFVAVAVLSALVTPPERLGWATLHLALAGAATLAIGTFMPHFAVTLAGAPAEASAARIAVLALLAGGSSMVLVGVSTGAAAAGAAGGTVLLLGIAGTAWMTLAPARRGIVRRHPIVQIAYGAALVQVAAGVSLAILYLVGWDPVVAAWASHRAAHVWLNLFGFISLTISATLVYLFPTAAGARIRPHPALAVLVIGCVGGPPLAALGFILGEAWLAVAGGWLTALGALGLLSHVVDVLRRRGQWAKDRSWHHLVIGHLSAGPAWLAAGTIAAVLAIVGAGSSATWSLGPTAIPLVGGWILQVLVGSWSHLVPAVGPGDPAAHARQRQILGRLAAPRLITWNVGVAAAWAGAVAGAAPLTTVGGGLVLVSVAAAVLLLALALRA